jgi:DNA replication and repair protein RecF
MTLDGADVRSFASRGQARTAALALRLAQCRIAFEDTGEWPIVLLDDVFAELDVSRRQLVAELAGEAQQVFASSASESDLPSEMQPAARVIRVCRGSIAIEENAGAVQA